MMPIPHVTPLYAALLGLMLVALSWRIMHMRGKLAVMVGDGGERDLNVAVRIQGNFIEYVPMALLLMFFAELQGWNGGIIHTLGVLLIFARLAHVHGMSQKGAAGAGRKFGARLTFAVIIAASLLCGAGFMGWAR